MALSLLLAKLFGIYLIIIGLFWILRHDYMLKVVQDYYKSPALIVISAVMSLLIGLLILLGHPVYELNWRGLITLIGGLSLLKGFVRLFALDGDKHLTDKFLQERVYIGFGIVWILLGLFLAYHGFKNELM